MRRITNVLLILVLLAGKLSATEEIVKQYYYSGPIEVHKPILSDSLNVNGKAWEQRNLLKTAISFDRSLQYAAILNTDEEGTLAFEQGDKPYALHLFRFYLNADRYTKGTLEVSGPGEFEVFVDNEQAGKTWELTLEPRRYEVVVKYLTTSADTCAHTIKALYKTEQDSKVFAVLSPEKRYTLPEMISGRDYRNVSLSPNGKMVLLRYSNRYGEGKSEVYTKINDANTGKTLLQGSGYLNSARWMAKSNKLYYTRNGVNGTELVALDPQTMQESVLAEQLPKGNFSFSPDETFLLFFVEEEGPKDGPDLVRVLEPADRIAGFRKRSFIWKYDLRNGLFEQITFGNNSTHLNDVSADSRYMLFSTSERIYTSRPHGRNSLYKLDLLTLAVDTIWESTSYRNHAVFSPDGKQLLVSGAAEAFGRDGLNIQEEQIANSYDGQLFIYNLQTKAVKPLTKEFDPSVGGAIWSKFDGQIYLTAEDKDFVRIYSCNPVNGKIQALNLSEDVVSSFSISETSPLLWYYGQSVSNANRLYAYDLKSNKSKLIEDLSEERLKDIILGETGDWDFTSSDGTTITGRYYLPPHFDAQKKYPMIVYYYGGTSPTNRSMEHRYSMHLYAAQGYVVYTLNPSGTTGFGQQFSSRHVNAWGIRTAEDIIEGTEKFCEEHPYVDKSKIGCIGASYGGFMTQYLQTRTDLFAAAVSHAGISALSSYWGEGYWGYGYCSVANADSYPWNNPQLFTEQSPLFQADKINTPLLLLHGSVDTNVPVGESIQMFAALKILGKEVEFIQVEGENHGIVGYKKRIGWKNSIYAWFAKWLKEQPEWWNDLYPERHL